jgi:pilus assembly protein CpaF
VLLRRIGTSDPSGGNTGQNPPATPQGGGLAQRKGDAAVDETRAINPRERNADVPMSKQDKMIYELKGKVQEKLVAELERKQISVTDEKQVRTITEEIFQEVLGETSGIALSRAEKQTLLEGILAEILGYGPLEILLRDESISEVMINGPKSVYIERKGRLVRSEITFQNDAHVMRIIERIVSPLGRRVDESSPMVDARLPDGSRVNIIIPPLSLNGPVVTIRKFSKKPLTVQDLINYGSLTSRIANFLDACVKCRLNIVVSGGTGSGKTTLLNVLSGFIPDDERIITVENAAELQLRQDHVITLESKVANIEGKGEVTIRDLVINCLRMRPDRIVVGECRGGETLDMLQAMNTGHDGSLTTLHANSPKDAISRTETMCLMAGMDLPVRAIREQIASAVDVIVQQERMKDGSRKITSIAEVDGMEGDIVKMTEIFRFEQTGVDENGKIIGALKPTGVTPHFIEKFEQHNIFLPPDTFGQAGQLRAF